MDDHNELFIMANFGTIKFKLDQVLEKKGHSRNWLAKKIGSRFEVIDHMYAGDLERIDVEILAKICFVLKCRVQDLLEYQEPVNEM